MAGSTTLALRQNRAEVELGSNRIGDLQKDQWHHVVVAMVSGSAGPEYGMLYAKIDDQAPLETPLKMAMTGNGPPEQLVVCLGIPGGGGASSDVYIDDVSIEFVPR